MQKNKEVFSLHQMSTDQALMGHSGALESRKALSGRGASDPARLQSARHPSGPRHLLLAT